MVLGDDSGGGVLLAPVLRFLATVDANTTNITDGGSLTDTTNVTDGGSLTGIDLNANAHLTDTEVIRTTSQTYALLFLAMFAVFLVARATCPGAYNLKRTYEHLRIPLAAQPFGPLSWTWRVFSVSEGAIAEQCGMDAATTIRLFEFGAKLSLVACANSVFLMPVYNYVGDAVEGEGGQPDPVKEHSLTNLPQGHPASIATAIAAYVFFFAAMHFVDKDFEWFTEHRHFFLAKRDVQNYSIFLSNLPLNMQSDTAIQNYFRDCFGRNKVVDGDVALWVPELEALNAKREALISKFEHAINVKTVARKEPTHRTKLFGGETVESIPAYRKELEDLNNEISDTVDRIVADKESRRAGDEEACGLTGAISKDDSWHSAHASQTSVQKSEAPRDEERPSPGSTTTAPSLVDITGGAADCALDAAADLADLGAKGLSTIKNMVVVEEGSARSAAFVSFSDLVSANTALQVVHHAEPWDMKADSAPRPDLVNWPNVGLNNQAKQAGELISLALTTALCFLWTIPVSFVASFSNVDGLVDLFPGLEKAMDTIPGLDSIMAQLAPLILVGFIKLLPHILLLCVKFERPIEKLSFQHPSLLSKLAAFTIIQTFFISTISGSVMEQLKIILDNPEQALYLVANALIGKSAFFIQLIVVQNFLGLGIEILRISPIVQEWLGTLVKKIVGYNLTEKEQNFSYLGIRDIADPLEYYYGRELGTKAILLMMVLYVYNAIAPITAYFTLAIFLTSAGCYRNQFIYIYPIANDSGGKLWLNFTKTSVTCMIIAEIVLCTIFFLKEAITAGILLVPLIVITFLFQQYFNKRHYMVTNFLPLGDCTVADKKNKKDGMTFEWLEDAYLQPAMKDRKKYPCNYDELGGTRLSAKSTQGAAWDMCPITDGRSQDTS